jgi:exosortase/archaeosortase family protein
MTRVRVRVVSALVLTFATVWIGFDFLLDRWRGIEAWIVSDALQAMGVAAVRVSYGNLILVVPRNGSAFLATISPSCSSLGAILAFGAISLFLVGGTPLRRLWAFLAASGLVLICNLVRIGLSVWVGVITDSDGLVVFHDSIGTAFGIIYVLAGFMVFLWILLPSNKQILKESGRRVA